MAFQLDEVISPVVLASVGLHEPPWRVDGTQWFCAQTTAAVAGQLSWSGVFVRQTGLVAVLDRIIFSNAGGGILVTLGQFSATPTSAFDTFTYEALQPTLNNAVTPVECWFETAAAPGISLAYSQVIVPSGGNLIIDFPQPIVLTLGNGTNQGFGALGGTVLQALNIAYYGRSWFAR